MSALIASACTAPPAANAPAGGQSSQATSGTLTIADWEFSENDMGANVMNVLKSFEQAHPGTKLNFQPMSYDTYPSTIKTQLGAGGGPDVMVLLDATFSELQKVGDLLPITSLTQDEISALRPGNQDAVINNQRLGYIWETVIYGMLYNKDLFAQAGISEAPKDFDALLSDCVQIKSKTGKWGYAARNMTDETEAWYEDFTGTWIIGYGGSWTDPNGKFTINIPANIQAVTDYAKLYGSGCYDTGVKASVFRPSFQNGDVAVLMDNANAGFTYTAGNKILTDQVMRSAPLPFPTPYSGEQQLFLSINKNTNNAALAQAFMEWLAQPAQQKALVEATAPQTTASKVVPSDAFNGAHAWAKFYYDQADKGKSLLMNARPEKTTQLASTVMPYIAKLLASQMTPTDALNAAQKDAVSAMGEP